MKNRIAFIGGGNMTRAIVGGLIDSGADPATLSISEPLEAARTSLAEAFPGVQIDADNSAVAASADCIVLSVKPQVLADVCGQLATTIQAHRPLIVSIAAGTLSDNIESWLGGNLAVVRVMPNQPALLRLGVSGLYSNERVDDAQRARASEVMAAVGTVVEVDSETDIDAITAVSGSGPAYFFLLIGSLIDAGISFGLDPESARTLAVETARGAAALAANEDASMDDLIARVRSPGGTTAAALDSLDAADARGIFSAAITAARDRSAELGNPGNDRKD